MEPALAPKYFYSKTTFIRKWHLIFPAHTASERQNEDFLNHMLTCAFFNLSLSRSALLWRMSSWCIFLYRIFSLSKSMWRIRLRIILPDQDQWYWSGSVGSVSWETGWIQIRLEKYESGSRTYKCAEQWYEKRVLS